MISFCVNLGHSKQIVKLVKARLSKLAQALFVYMQKVGVPQILFFGFLGSASTKRLKNTALKHSFLTVFYCGSFFNVLPDTGTLGLEVLRVENRLLRDHNYTINGATFSHIPPFIPALPIPHLLLGQVFSETTNLIGITRIGLPVNRSCQRLPKKITNLSALTVFLLSPGNSVSNSKVTFSALHRFKIEIAGIRVLETRGRKKDMMAAELTSSS